VDALAAAIETLVADPEQRALLGAKGRAFAELHLSPAWVLGRLDEKLRALRGERAVVRAAERKDAKTVSVATPSASKGTQAVKLVEIEKID
jgi:colanic acid biosynthesis glycosyl transferase WcaI